MALPTTMMSAPLLSFLLFPGVFATLHDQRYVDGARCCSTMADGIGLAPLPCIEVHHFRPNISPAMAVHTAMSSLLEGIGVVLLMYCTVVDASIYQHITRGYDFQCGSFLKTTRYNVFSDEQLCIPARDQRQKRRHRRGNSIEAEAGKQNHRMGHFSRSRLQDGYRSPPNCLRWKSSPRRPDSQIDHLLQFLPGVTSSNKFFSPLLRCWTQSGKFHGVVDGKPQDTRSPQNRHK